MISTMMKTHGSPPSTSGSSSHINSRSSRYYQAWDGHLQDAGCSQQQTQAALALLAPLLQGGTWLATGLVVLLLPQLAVLVPVLVLVLVCQCTAPQLLLRWASAAAATQLLDALVLMMWLSCGRGGLCWMTLCLWRCWCSRW
jgi:hypothetical protein